MKNVDVVICDYNYVFAPRSSQGRIVDNYLGEEGKPNLVIDEFHNLPERGMSYYSPSLSVSTFEKMLKEIDGVIIPFRKKTENLLHQCISIVNKCAPANKKIFCKIEPPVTAFIRQDNKLREFLSQYLNSDVVIQPRDLVMRLSYYWSEFTAALEFMHTGRKEFFTTFNPSPPTVKITCCDASEMLKTCYDDFAQVVGFSATLKPFEFYSQLSGLKSEQLKTAEFISPFPRDRKKILIIPQISSKYSERERNYQRIAEAIQKISAMKVGNYFAFFPSFEFMRRTLEVFTPVSDFKVLHQVKGMNKIEIKNVLESLNNENLAHIVFAVQGGVFSEGLDYPGNMAIGAFIIGPPLPNFDLEREKMKEYYQQYYSAGFDYAYIFPAMAKAVQAAGRVIRSETDKGIIVLMDNRFIQPNYSKCMPQDWFAHDSGEIVSNSILKEISTFWTEV